MDFARAQQLIKPQRGERLKLGLRNLYILPTRFGLLWLAGGGLLLLVAIQSQRNGPLLLSFLMLVLWLLALTQKEQLQELRQHNRRLQEKVAQLEQELAGATAGARDLL